MEYFNFTYPDSSKLSVGISTKFLAVNTGNVWLLFAFGGPKTFVCFVRVNHIYLIVKMAYLLRQHH